MTTRVAIIGARWPDIDVELDVLGVDAHELVADRGETSAAIVAAAAESEVILAGPLPRFDRDTLAQLRCRAIVRYGVGYDNIDVAAADEYGIRVGFVPDYGTEAVALHAVALVLAALRRIPMADRVVKEGTWSVETVKPLRIPASLTAGVVGFGRIGRATARHLRDLGFGRVVAFDEYVEVDEAGVKAASLDALLEDSDVVTLHAPGAGDSRPLIGFDEIASMKKGSVIVNTARGSLIDTDALVSGLRVGRPELAALDVFEPEPVDLAQFAEVADQMIMTPHMAWYTEESERALRVKTAEEGRRVLEGQPLRNKVEVKEVS